MERVLGPQLGDVIRALHEEKACISTSGKTVSAFEAGRGDPERRRGASMPILWSLGVGVRPRTQLAEAAGLAHRPGVTVNELSCKPARRTSTPPATSPAGPTATAARPSGWSIGWWPSARARQRRATCWALREDFTAVPFFWSQHYDVSINYVGHAESWDEILVEGDLAAKDGLVRFRRAGRDLAVASLFRDLDSLKAERDMERA